MKIWPTLFASALLTASISGQAQSAGTAPSISTEQKSADRRLVRDRLLATADRAAGASAKQGGSPDTLRTGVFAEAKYRLLAAIFSEEAIVQVSDIARTEAVAKRADLTPAQRYELSRLVSAARGKGRKHGSFGGWQAQRERDAIQLWREFPEVSDAAMVLLEHASRSDAKRMAELAAMVEVKAPTGIVKQRAQALLARASLERENLFSLLLETKGGSSLAKEAAGRPVVFYTWSPRDRGKDAAFIAAIARAPRNALIVGIAIGADARLEGRAAFNAPLPGRQLYGGRDDASPIAERLTLTEPGMVLVADSLGKVRVFSGHASPAAAFANLR